MHRHLGSSRSRLRRRRPALLWLFLAVACGLLSLTVGVTAPVGASSRAGAQTACTAPAWSSSALYHTGDQVTYNGHQWRANHDTWPGLAPGGGVPPWWVPWADLGACGSGATTTTAPPSTTTTTAPPGSTTTTSTPGSTTSTTVPSGGDVEDHFTAPGPWAVTTGTVTVPGATTGPVTMFYPTNLGQDGYQHPILTYASGTSGTPNDPLPSATLRHLASWGYVIAGVNSPGLSAEGQEADAMRASADYLVAQDGNSSSTFFEKLDTAKVGVLGHSQGAAATLLLVGSSRNADGLFSSAAPLALPDRGWWAGTTNPNYSLVTDPIFFFSGTSDFFTAQSEQTFFFNSVPGPAAKAAAVGKDHSQMIPASTAYLTAWFKYTLEGDQFARTAFVGNPPQVATNPDWTNWAAKNLL